MKKIYYFLFFLSFISITAQTQDTFKITHGPYLTDMDDTGVTIIWTTNRNAVSWVEIAPDDGSHFYNTERPRFFDSRNGRKQAASSLHRVRISNLQPGVSYRYAVFSKEVIQWENDSRIYYGTTVANSSYANRSLKFSTFSATDDTVSFLVFNDLHGRAQFMKDVCKNIDFKGIDMVIFNGDMSTAIYNEEQLFTDFIDASVELFSSRIPIIFNRGNHETRGTFSDKLDNYFPKTGGTVYQTLNVGKTAFLILDCGEDKPDSDIEYSGLADFDAYRVAEASWLKEAVNLNSYKNSQTRIAILHMPLLMSTWHGTVHLNEQLLPILNQANVTAMFSGHTHRYSYNLKEPGKIEFPILVNSNNGVIRCDIINGKVKTKIYMGDGSKPQELILN
jgi:predicted phosphodiesterase